LPRRLWEDNLKEEGCEDETWMVVAQDRIQWQTVTLAVFTVAVKHLLCD